MGRRPRVGAQRYLTPGRSRAPGTRGGARRMTVSLDYDAVTAEVISMGLQDVVNEMAVTVERTSGSPGVAEAQDYSCVIVRPDGRCMAYFGNNLEHLGSSLCGT